MGGTGEDRGGASRKVTPVKTITGQVKRIISGDGSTTAAILTLGVEGADGGVVHVEYLLSIKGVGQMIDVLEDVQKDAVAETVGALQVENLWIDGDEEK